MAVAGTLSMVAFLATGVPLVFVLGLTGLAIGIAAQAAVHLVCRAYFLQRLFDGFSFLRHAARAAVPSIPATALVVLLRVLEPFERSLAVALLELAVYAIVTALLTILLERRLLREAVGYVMPRLAVRAA
jgi:hypothetical protein